MLTLKDNPKWAASLYRECKKLSREIHARVESLAHRRRLPPETDLLGTQFEGTVVFIMEGYFRLCRDNRVIRLYSDSDLLVPDTSFRTLTLRSEYATEVNVLDTQAVLTALQEDRELLEKWISLQNLEGRLGLSLYADTLNDDLEAGVEFREFGDGEVIVREAEPSAAVYELVTGRAVVLKGSRHVGNILEGEIFGEMGFLTGTPRTATVRADGVCFVRVMEEKVFSQLIRTNPSFIMSISRTLASRIVELNAKLTGQPNQAASLPG